MLESLINYKSKDKQELLKIILIIMILSADIGRAIGIGNINLYVAVIVSFILIISSILDKSKGKFKYLKSESIIYGAISVIIFLMILYINDLRNIIHALKLFLIFFVIYPSIRSFYTSKQIILALKINLIINFALIIIGKLGIEVVSRLTGTMRGSTVLNYAGSLYKVGAILIPYLIWDIIKNDKDRLINIVLLLISMYIMLFDGSRTGIISVAMIAFIYGVMALINIIRKTKFSFKSLTRNVIFTLIIGVFAAKNYDKILNSNAYSRGIEFMQLLFKFNIAEFLMKGDAIRGQMILDALKSIKSNYFILGNGFGSTMTQGIVIHNAYLQMFADLGLIAVVCLIIVLVYPMFIGIKNIKKNKALTPSIISLIMFAFAFLLHPFSVQIAEWAFYLIPLAIIVTGIKPKIIFTIKIEKQSEGTKKA